MGGLPYYKRYPRDALNGMMGLTLEQRGAYNTILDLIYDEGGPIRDDERWMCAHLNCDPRVWRRLKAQLMELGKIHLDDEGRISNARSNSELSSTEDMRNVRRTSGAAGGKASAKSRGKGQQKQGKPEANASALGQAITDAEPEPITSIDKPIEVVRLRGSRIPADWQPSMVDRAYASHKGFNAAATDLMAEKFKNYWTAATGKGATKMSWSATWRTWVIREAESRLAPAQPKRVGFV